MILIHVLSNALFALHVRIAALYSAKLQISVKVLDLIKAGTKI